MTEQFILHYAPVRLAQQGYSKYHLRYRDLVVEPFDTITLQAHNDLYFIVDEPSGLLVDSDYGVYDTTDDPVAENVHVHRGEIKISNPGNVRRRIKLIQAIIVN